MLIFHMVLQNQYLFKDNRQDNSKISRKRIMLQPHLNSIILWITNKLR